MKHVQTTIPMGDLGIETFQKCDADPSVNASQRCFADSPHSWLDATPDRRCGGRRFFGPMDCKEMDL